MDCVIVTGDERHEVFEGLGRELARVGTMAAVTAICWPDPAKAPENVGYLRATCRACSRNSVALIPGHEVSLSRKADYFSLLQELRRNPEYKEEVFLLRLLDPLLFEEKGLSLQPIVTQVRHLVVTLDGTGAQAIHIPQKKFPRMHASFAISYFPLIAGTVPLISFKESLRALHHHVVLPLRAQLLCLYIRPIFEHVDNEMLLLRALRDVNSLVAVLLGTRENLFSINVHVLRQIKKSVAYGGREIDLRVAHVVPHRKRLRSDETKDARIEVTTEGHADGDEDGLLLIEDCVK